jgi:hypothetical protein
MDFNVKKNFNLMLDLNPLLDLSIVYMTNPSAMDNKFDIAIWLVVYFYYATKYSFSV